jgi:alkylhydroperoxidase/carboxymuconolactone decarboxylase family protein YurZ
MHGDRYGADLLTKRKEAITIALMTALGMMSTSLKSNKNTGATVDDVKEVLLHTAVYAGVPAANAAIRIAKEIFGEKK